MTSSSDIAFDARTVEEIRDRGIPATAASALREVARRELRHGRGYLVLQAPKDLVLTDARSLLIAVSHVLGTVMPQDFEGERIREVRDRGSDITMSRSARYSDTRFGGHLHTDGMHRPGHIPDYFTLYCHRPAISGGESVFLHVEDIIERLRPRPAVLAVLAQNFHFDSRDTSGIGPCTVLRPVLEDTPAGMRINYLRQYIDSGHTTPGVPGLSAEQIAALDAMDEVLTDTSLYRFARLNSGQLMVINNRRLVHGRTDFTDSEAPERRRLLLRTWIDAR
ncbi:TauD/TfdA family dioxygenase [Streptomyces uncialis]|uniref:TauD/TfdA family dioxygenase n=1 Tax=Streptomyces uncialis TaxID=1048205 RepID=UPI002E3031E1|nr:TauD/TfdA family dioxygenase [Streptomyces uncialis]